LKRTDTFSEVIFKFSKYNTNFRKIISENKEKKIYEENINQVTSKEAPTLALTM